MAIGRGKSAGNWGMIAASAFGPPVETAMTTTLGCPMGGRGPAKRAAGANLAAGAGGPPGNAAFWAGGGAQGAKNWRILGASSARKVAIDASSEPQLAVLAT